MGVTRAIPPDRDRIIRGDQYFPSDLVDIAKDWGFHWQMSSALDAAQGQDEPALGAGFIATQKLPCGLNICTSDLTTLQDNDRVGITTRSLTIALNFGGSTVSYSIDDGQPVDLVAGGAVALWTSDKTRMASRYRRGESSRILVIQTCPITAQDTALAEHLDALLIETAAKPLLVGCRVRTLARELFSSDHTGMVGRLLAESCALEVLAWAIGDQQRDSTTTTCSIHPRDVAKIHRVRDKLLATLDADHHLCDLARDVGMSASTLKCKFSAVVGQPVFQFLRDKRLDRARDGLSYEGWTVSQAAFYVGYRHATNFATAFRRRFGVAPTSVSRSSREGGATARS